MTPEEIVGLIGNIGNRPDIRETHKRQIKEIKEFAAKQLEEYAKYAHDNIDYPLSGEDEVTNKVLSAVHKHLIERANNIRNG